jgi:predicted DNA-binding transcriptional regulator
MNKTGNNGYNSIEKAVNNILKSKARSSIYIYLLKKNGARTEQIIKGTKLHPSTVRETLSGMYDQKLIYRKKIKNDSIGKNPYMYYPLSPIEFLKRYANEIEDGLNKIASLAFTKEKTMDYKSVKINIYDRVDQT